jgi:hypothetical protein
MQAPISSNPQPFELQGASTVTRSEKTLTKE